MVFLLEVIFFSIVEAMAVLYLGPALFGIKLDFRKTFLGGSFAGASAKFLKSFFTIHKFLPFANLLVMILLLIMLLRFYFKLNWGLASASTLLSVLILVICETLMIAFVFPIFNLNIDNIPVNPLRYILMGYEIDSIYFLFVIFVRLSGYKLINLSDHS